MNSNAHNGRRFNYLFGLINLAAVFCIVWLLWYVFMNPNAVMRLYDPMYGLSLILVFMAGMVLMINVADYYPFQAGGSNVITRGIILVAVAFLLMLFIYYIVFWNFIGRLGFAYFSPQSIVASGGIGAEPLNARMIAAIAILYFCVAFLWWAMFWSLGFGRWPWTNTSRGVLAWSRFFTVMFFTVISYAILFHPVVCHLFYPVQNKAGVSPWWIFFAGTACPSFSLGLMFCILPWIIMSHLLWEGYPWKLLEKDGQGTFAKGLVTFFGTAILGVITFIILLKIMNIFLGEAFVGGQYTDGLDFRYMHTAEISVFFMLAATILRMYFNNFPHTRGLWPRAIIRTAITIAGGILIYFFYYSPATIFFLGYETGKGSPMETGDTPLGWVMLFLCIIMIQEEFFQGWPLRRTEGS
jgi:amino acid transporter, AAT family